jgi:hypothetical protein
VAANGRNGPVRSDSSGFASNLSGGVGPVCGIFRRIGSMATTLSLSVGRGLEPPLWRSLIELDRNARGADGWVDKKWGVARPYAASEFEAVVAA